MEDSARIIILKYIQAVDALKREAIDMYEHFIQRASYGYKDDYQFILNLISFINMPIELDK